jgi:hypothetical protein
MTREEFIHYPAISASRIKKFYTGDISYAKNALDKGANFHFDLLETEVDQMNGAAKNVYDAFQEVPLLATMFEESIKEQVVVADVVIGGNTVQGKCAIDMNWDQQKILADIKTTSAKSIEAFAADMIKHANHIQAVWYSILMGTDPKCFYYIGVTPKVKKSGKFADLFLYRHNQDEIDSAKELIVNFIEQFDGDYSRR